MGDQSAITKPKSKLRRAAESISGEKFGPVATKLGEEAVENVGTYLTPKKPDFSKTGSMARPKTTGKGRALARGEYDKVAPGLTKKGRAVIGRNGRGKKKPTRESIGQRSIAKTPSTGSPATDSDAVAQDARRGNRKSDGGYGGKKKAEPKKYLAMTSKRIYSKAGEEGSKEMTDTAVENAERKRGSNKDTMQLFSKLPVATKKKIESHKTKPKFGHGSNPKPKFGHGSGRTAPTPEPKKKTVVKKPRSLGRSTPGHTNPQPSKSAQAQARKKAALMRGR